MFSRFGVCFPESAVGLRQVSSGGQGPGRFHPQVPNVAIVPGTGTVVSKSQGRTRAGLLSRLVCSPLKARLCSSLPVTETN